MKALKFYILDSANCLESHEGILLSCLLKNEADKTLQYFHEGDCGGHIYWKSTTDKILSASFY